MTYLEVSLENFPHATDENHENSFGMIFAPSESRTGNLAVAYNYKMPTDEY